jgi:hypothetical protein
MNIDLLNNYLQLLPILSINNNNNFNANENVNMGVDVDNNILYTSLYDEPNILNVITKHTENQLNEITFDKKICKNDKCPITFDEFNVNDIVILLDCHHCFEPASIKKWLSEHKAECPICRLKLDSIEINVKNNNCFNSDVYHRDFIDYTLF